jgi:N-acetylgalactosamine kinase
MAVSDEFSTVRERFEREFSRPAEWFVRAPGRVNLIGEHVDYNGYPVLPMAITQGVRLACAPRDDAVVELCNADGFIYEARSFELSDGIPAYEDGDWGNYAKAAVQSLTRLALERGRAAGELRGLSCLVHGDVPPAAGLSSSTALVVGVGLVFAAVNRLEIGRQAMAERMAEAEHYVGTQGGGMDQAACLLAREGHVLKVEFGPLRATRLPFPADYCIVGAHSTIEARKTAQQRLAYNRRVLECALGAHLLGRALSVEAPQRLADLARYVANAETELPRLLHTTLKGRDSLSLRGAAAVFETDPGRFARQYLRMGDGRLLPMPGDGLKVLSRCRHVFSEARRTHVAESCLKKGDMARLGQVMDESHASCAEDLEVSCYELNQLVEIMRDAGALGARLTGAGFGGFAIALAHTDAAKGILQAVRQDFYAHRPAPPKGAFFVCRPAQGAIEQTAE